MTGVLEYLDAAQEQNIAKLAEAVSIKSVSADPALRQEVHKMAEWLKARIEEAAPGSRVWLEKNVKGSQKFVDGVEKEYPPLVCAEIGTKSADRKTLLIYAHYDVQPAEKSDGWDTDPWTLTRVDDKLYGRGSTDDKGPIVGWLCVIKAFYEVAGGLPINLKLVFEGMEESGSDGFDETVGLHKSKNPEWWTSCDWCAVSDNYWLGTTKPCLSYGLRGVTCFEVEINGPNQDLHSGIYGGSVFEPMDDLMHIYQSMKDKSGKCLIKGINEPVAPVTDVERDMYERLSFDIEEYRANIGVEKLRFTNKTDVLMSRWRYPVISFHGIEGAFSGSGIKTVIPKRVIGKFSVRTVPKHTPEDVEKSIREHLNQTMQKRRESGETSNSMTLKVESGPWFYVDPSTSAVFKAADQAIQEVWGVAPDYTREGGSIPVTVTLSELTGKDLCLIPMGRADDGAHSQNEKLDISNYCVGMKTFARMLELLAKY